MGSPGIEKVNERILLFSVIRFESGHSATFTLNVVVQKVFLVCNRSHSGNWKTNTLPCEDFVVLVRPRKLTKKKNPKKPCVVTKHVLQFRFLDQTTNATCMFNEGISWIKFLVSMADLSLSTHSTVDPSVLSWMHVSQKEVHAWECQRPERFMLGFFFPVDVTKRTDLGRRIKRTKSGNRPH